MQLLISDANILIDLEEGKLLNSIFTLPYKFSTPDMLFYDELAEQHSHLLDMGLTLGGLSSESMQNLQILTDKHRQPSRYDCMALVLAQQENCPLLTGDKELRKSAEQEGVEVKGTIWLVEALVQHNIITTEQARESYQKMKDAGRRLPYKVAEQRLAKLENKQQGIKNHDQW